MTFWTSLRNPPEEARYWMPKFYYRDPVTGFYATCGPGDHLYIGQPWLFPLSAGDGIMMDYRCVVYDEAYNIIGIRDLDNIIVRDDEEFIYDWEPEEKKGISPWVILAPVGILAVIGIAVAAKKR